MRVFSTVRRVAQLAKNFADLPRPRKLVVVNPRHFDVKYVINPHMEGKVGTVDVGRAAAQWQALRTVYERLGYEVHELDGQPGYPDMVFSANHGVSYPGVLAGPGQGDAVDAAVKEVFMSNMGTGERRGEVPYFEKWYKNHGYNVHHLPADLKFEGMGDALWHGTKKLLWGGHGFRTSLRTYDIISAAWDVPVVALELLDPDFYHIDTCLAVLNEDTVLIYPGAFTSEGQDMIRHLVKNVIEAPEAEARRNMACNAFCPDGRNVVLQAGSSETVEKLKRAGFNVIEVDTTEFMKGGGSVFCMKMLTW